ncbi:MAG: hypothetical protein SFV23_16775, partial [Planctomycetaceae bacterium]|nr:hypothetical protein [Planctomycetaceae bacterium]
MKRPSTATAKLRQDRARRRADALPTLRNRRGSTLMIVIVLLALLSVLGVLFYSFANQERSNAEYYADGAKVVEAPGLTADTLFDHALEQLIVGPDPRFKNSVLWGKRHSLLANTQGLRDQSIADLTAYDGQGVLLAQSVGAPFVDQDLDGMADSGNVLDRQGNVVQTSENGSNVQDLLGINDSPAANNLFERETYKLPQPDVGYTYPDQNSAFLAYIGWVRDRNTPLGAPRPVIIPSFHRPALYRDSTGEPIPLWEDLNYDGDVTDTILTVMEDRNGNTTADLGSAAANQQFRAHPGHVYVPPGQRGNTTVSRYISSPPEAAALLGDPKRVFPFLPMYDGYNPVDDGSGGLNFTGRPADWIGHQGVWGGPHPDPMFNDAYQYDVDNDGDGIREGVWLDLDFPVQELSDGTLYIPMFSFTVLDLDGLINLNAHGNIQNLLFPLDSGGGQAVAFNNNSNQFGFNVVTGQVEFLSQSNLGLHAAEVNPAWALTGRAGLDNATASSTVFDQYRQFYGRVPFDAATLTGSDPFRRLAFQETANMDLAYLKFGRPEVTGSVVDDLHPGLYGEEHLISRNFAPGANNALAYPHPGQSTSDDNGDLNENMQYAAESSGTPANWLDVDQPRDTIGIGSITSGTNVKALDLTDPAPTGPGNRIRWLRYTGYATNNGVFWGQTSVQTGGLMQSNQAYGLYDDPSEVALYAEDRRDVDDPLEPADSAFLQMDNDDINNLGITSRLEDLASFNFSTTPNTNARGEAIRKRFTTESNDRKSYSLPQSIGRPWEWNDDQGFAADSSNDKLRFPPVFGPSGSVISRYSNTDPFRSPVRYLLQATRDDLQVKQFQQRLAVNKVLVFDWNNPNSTELVYRDLTLHPLDPGSTPIPTTQPQYRGSYPWPNAVDQEYWARRDRQLLARDIYVLLYLLGAGQNGDAMNNPLVTAGATFYTPRQLQQMAQFAVNLVDAQDKDRVITRFEYDTDLSNGWNLDDNPYTPNTAASEPDTLAGTDRAEVWGVERQELAINEYLAFETAAETADVTPQTQHDDSDERHFLCVELRNLAPYEIRFDDNATWQLVLRQVEPGDMSYDATMERQLTLKAGSGTVVPGGFYTIFSTDRNDPVNGYNMTSNPSPSAFRVDPDGSGSVEWIVPRDAAFNTPVAATGNHLDVVGAIAGNGNSYVEITDGSGADLLMPATGNEGALLTNGAPGNLLLNRALPVNMILRRRAHPTRTRPTTMNTAQEEDNPWVEVDRASIAGNEMPVFNYPDSGNDATGQLASLQSWQRDEPLFR